MKRHHPNKSILLQAESVPKGTPPPRANRVITRVETGVFVAILIGAIVLHVVSFLHFGGLWRDEVNTVNTSTLPTLPDLWNTLQFESFPILWLLVLRTWITLGFGGTDLALRALGLIVGISILVTLWLVGRKLEMRFPLVSLVLLALCPTVFWGDTLRAYGLGVILILLAMGSLWRAIEDPVPWKISGSLVTAVLSVQCLYHNAFLLFALCVGGAAVGLSRRRWRLALFPLGVGAIAATSMLPYYMTVAKTRTWDIIFTSDVSFPWIFTKFQQAIDPSGIFLSWVWFILCLVTLGVGMLKVFKPSRKRFGSEQKVMLFVLVTALVSTVFYAVFIKILSYPTQVWYYLPLMAVLAVIIDKGIDMVCATVAIVRWLRIVCVVGVAACVFSGSWDAAHVRRTNVDLIAAKVESIAEENDLIVVFPFYYGISFARYYNGKTRWITLPEIEDHSAHRYDVFKEKMMQLDPIGPAIGEMLQTLEKKHCVWLVGGLNFLRRGEQPGNIAPAPRSPYRWNESAYHLIWSRQAAFVLETHGEIVRRIRVPVFTHVSAFENVPLFKVEGWRS